MSQPQPPTTPGLHRYAGPADAARRALEAAGWRTGVVEGAATKADALAAIGRALHFPAYYGRNLDALADCLGDLPAHRALVWADWDTLRRTHPRDAAALEEVLAERAGAQPGFVVVLAAD